jgi:hypothetical protein
MEVCAMPLPVIESVGLGYKIANLGWEMFKATRTSTGVTWNNKTGYRFVSSLTTLEFSYNGSKQTSHYVQDRTIEFTKNEKRLPPFRHQTSGNDFVDGLIVDDASVPWIKSADNLIRRRDDVEYAKGDTARAILLAHSEDGFPKDEEDFQFGVNFWIESAVLAIIFPDNKKPDDLFMVFQNANTNPGDWRAAKGERYEVRCTTRGRLAFTWETENLKRGTLYKIVWKW